MKKIIVSLLCFLMLVSFSGCSSTNSNSKTNEYFKIIGVYCNENDSITNSEDNVSRNWINIIYEINNTTDTNWEDEFYFGDDVNVLTLGSNDYQFDLNNTSYLADYYGFKAPGVDYEVWAGEKSSYLVNFIVNQKDIKEDMKASFYIKYCDMEYTYDFKYSDLKPYTKEEMKKIASESKKN